MSCEAGVGIQAGWWQWHQLSSPDYGHLAVVRADGSGSVCGTERLPLAPVGPVLLSVGEVVVGYEQMVQDDTCFMTGTSHPSASSSTSLPRKRPRHRRQPESPTRTAELSVNSCLHSHGAAARPVFGEFAHHHPDRGAARRSIFEALSSHSGAAIVAACGGLAMLDACRPVRHSVAGCGARGVGLRWGAGSAGCAGSGGASR